MEIELVLYLNQYEITCDLICKFWKSHNHYEISMNEAHEDLKKWTSMGHKLYLIKYMNHYIGFVHLGSRGCAIDWLEDIFILKEYQNKGIGSKVISIIEDIVKKYSDSLYIEAAAHNIDAIRLYHRIGYDCLNTITIRKDFHINKTEKISEEKIHDLDFEVRKYK